LVRKDGGHDKEHYEGVPHAEAMHLLTALQDWLAMLYLELLKD
jgi:hypothetical protein